MIAISALAAHEAADIFPLMDENDYQELKADIAANGLRQEIVIYQQRILDGRNRYRACIENGIEPRLREYDGDDPLGFVVSMNLHRRHLSASQRAMIAAELADLKRGGSKAQICALTHAQAADRLKVSARQVDKASALLNAEASGRAATELVEHVRNGKVSLNKAEWIARHPEQQPEIVAQGDRHTALRTSARKPRQQWMRQFDQVARETELLCYRIARLRARAEEAGELTLERRNRLAHACRGAARRFTVEAERLEQRRQGCDLMPVEEI